MADPALDHRTRLRGALLLGVVFVLGLVCGAALFYTGQRSVGFWTHDPSPPPMRHERMFRHIARQLDMDEEQVEKMREVLDRSHTEVRAVLEDAHAELRSMLRPDQLERFDELHAGRHEPGHRPFGGPPRGRRRGPPPPD
jgi:Spy/CpxP family protein refolding chaperone